MSASSAEPLLTACPDCNAPLRYLGLTYHGFVHDEGCPRIAENVQPFKPLGPRDAQKALDVLDQWVAPEERKSA